MESIILEVNWVAVIVGTILSFLLGWLWYSPKMFGVKWAEGVVVKLGSASEMPVKAMVTQLFGTFLLAWVVGVAMVNSDYALAILVAVTLSAFIRSSGLYSKKSYYAIMVESVFMLTMVAVMLLTHTVL
jgi:F0F1-type ATP synthase membrane subunit c/vacuolar-type H+-ATPase subunit K